MKAPARWVWVAVACTLAGCAVTAPESKLFDRVGARQTALTPDELRVRVRALATRFSGLLESLGDEIAAMSSDPAVRAKATRFKINAIPAVQSALFQPDPVAALIDCWVLLEQIDGAVSKQLGGEALRAHVHQRIGAMTTDLEGLWGDLAGPAKVPLARRRIEEFAEANPLTESLASRKSTVPLLARLTSTPQLSLAGAAGSLVQQTRDLEARLDTASAFIPKEVRWQLDALMQDSLHDPSLRLAAAGAADLVDRQRRALVAALEQELGTTRALVTSERRAVIDEVRAERVATIDALHGERVAAMNQMEQMGDAWIDHAFDRATVLVDRLLVGLLLLLALLAVAALLALALVRGAHPRSPVARRPQHRPE